MQVLRRVQLSLLPSTNPTTTSTSTDTAMGEESCVQVLRRVQLSPPPSTGTKTHVVAAASLSTVPSVRRALCPSAPPTAALSTADDWHQCYLHRH